MKILRKLVVAATLLISSTSLSATYFSQVGSDGVVLRTIVIPDAFAATGAAYSIGLTGVGTWVQAFIDGSGPGYAGVGTWYDGTKFINNISVSVIGDSIVMNMAAVQSVLPFPFPPSQNLGVSGDKIEQIQARIGSISRNATHVIIEGGVNDLRQQVPGNIIPAYTAILNSLTPSHKVIVIGMTQVDESLLDATGLAFDTNAQIAAMNTQIATLCATYTNCTMSSVRSISMAGKTADGLHPLPAEYNEIANALLSSL